MSEQNTNRVEIALQEGMHFEATGADNVMVSVDASREHGGSGSGLRPLELLLVGLGTCTAMDVISILRKKRQEVTTYRIEVEGRQADEHPRVFTEISVKHVFRGNGLSEEAIRRAIELSETKYCPAYAMLKQATPISSTFEIEQPVPTD